MGDVLGRSEYVGVGGGRWECGCRLGRCEGLCFGGWFRTCYTDVGYLIAEVAIESGASVTLCEDMDDRFGYVREGGG